MGWMLKIEGREAIDRVALGLPVPGGGLEDFALHVEDSDAAVKQKRVWDDVAHTLTGAGGCHDEAVREFLEGGADVRGGLGGCPEFAKDHPRPQGLQKAIGFHLSARLELSLTVFGELLAESQGDGGNREEHGRCANDLPRQNPGHGGQPGKAGELGDQDKDAGRIGIATKDQVEHKPPGDEADQQAGGETKRQQQSNAMHDQNSLSVP